MDGFMCRLCVNLTYRQTKAVLVIYPYFTASQLDFETVAIIIQQNAV
jgi:hypothetical protein